MHYTKSIILKEALKLARKEGFQNITMPDIARAAEVVNGTVVVHFTNMEKLRRDLLRYAIDKEDLIVIAQGLVVNHTVTRKIDRVLKERAFRYAIDRK